MSFLEKQLEKNIQTLIAEHFNVEVGKTDNLYLLGLMPRDIVKLVYLIESKFNIQFSESELTQVTFDSIVNIVSAINLCMKK